MIYSQSLKFTKNPEEAEDMTQEIFLKAFEGLSSFKGESRFSTWLFKIGQNLLLTKQRKSKKMQFSSGENIESISNPVAQTLESRVIEKETNQRIQSLLSKLPGVYKNPLVLYYFENMSYPEIAAKLNLKMNTLKSHILRGKELLKRWMQNEKSEDETF